MDNPFILLADKEKMWAEMLIEALKNEGVPCVSFPVYGAAMALKMMGCERLKVYVPQEEKEKAQTVLLSLFGAEQDT